VKSITDIYFNDTFIGTTDRTVDYERENALQKEYRITDQGRGLTAVFFCEEVKLLNDLNNKIIIEIS